MGEEATGLKTQKCPHPCDACNQDKINTQIRELEKAHMATYRQLGMSRSEAIEMWSGIENEEVDNELFDKLAERCGEEFVISMEENIAALNGSQRPDETRPGSCSHSCEVCEAQEAVDAIMKIEEEHMHTYRQYGLGRKDAVELWEEMEKMFKFGEGVDIEDVESRFGAEYCIVVEQRMTKLEDVRKDFYRGKGLDIRKVKASSTCTQQ